MSIQVLSNRPRTTALVAAIAAVIAIGLSLGTQTSAQTQRNTQDSAGSTMSLAAIARAAYAAAKTTSYPEVVARVNGRPIYGKELAIDEAAAQYADSTNTGVVPGIDAGTASTESQLDTLIADEVLIQAAEAQGFTISDADLSDQLSNQQQMIAKDGSEDSKEVLNAEMTYLEVTPSQFPIAPVVLAQYRRADALGYMLTKIRGTLSKDKQADPQAFRQAVSDFLAVHPAKVEILISGK